MKNSRSSYHTAAALLLATALLAGCATHQPTRTGYLPDYDTLQPVGRHSGLTAKRAETWAGTAMIIVVPVTWSAPENSGDTLTAEEKSQLTALAQTELRQAIRAYPAPNVGGIPLAELRATITRVEVSNAAVNVVSTLALLAPLDNGGVCVEWQLVGTGSGRVLAQGVATHRGKPWNFVASFERTGHAALGLKAVSAQIAAYLEARKPA